MSDISIGVVITVGPGREENIQSVLHCLEYNKPDYTVVVRDGEDAAEMPFKPKQTTVVNSRKHMPGMVQPRNVGVNVLTMYRPDITHVWFLDSDLVFEPSCIVEIRKAYALNDPDRIMVCPYDWLPEGKRQDPKYGVAMPRDYHELHNDPRWSMFYRYRPQQILQGDLSAGLACFSGNLVWPIHEFKHVGGFWNEIHHGRCEDGELGLRAVAMEVPISFADKARAWHQWHPINIEAILDKNRRDVPMLNERHPWVQGSEIFISDRDGKSFAYKCDKCEKEVPVDINWWDHSIECSDIEVLSVAS